MSQGLIQGSMREAPLPDIIQLVSQGGKSGCFHITEDPKRAKIFLKDGRISHAITNDAEGLDAVYEVALWLDGHYHFEEGEQNAPVTITKSNATVLMEMHRRMDEWRVINQKISSLDLYPNSTLLPGETPHGVSPREAKLLNLITGFYTVAELAEVLQKPVLTIAKDVYGLIMAGHVTLKGVRSGRRPELPADMAPPAPAAPVEPARPEPVAAHVAPVVPAPEPTPQPRPAVVTDPSKMAKLSAFNQRIVQAAKSVLPAQHHEMVNQLYAKATQQVMQGEGPESVKNLALAISRGAVDAGCDAEMVKTLNAQLKALFSK
jgi:hypothetical protein